jgi:alkaline phosphatase D
MTESADGEHRTPCRAAANRLRRRDGDHHRRDRAGGLGPRALLTRRRLLRLGAGAPALLLLGCAGLTSRLGYPFSLGVASGDPTPDGFVLWTRLLPEGGLGPEPVELRWEVASDEGMTRLVRTGRVEARADEAHSVHVELAGLASDRWYWYRFIAAGEASRVGRTRTTPAPGSTPPALRFAFASCQQYEQGYYVAHRDIAARGPDLVCFLGDYIYESSWGRHRVRSHGAPEPHSLDEYRARYALYRSDRDLQAAHEAAPWLVTWDDHEVVDDYAKDRARAASGAAFLARRAAAYRAFWEHMPLPRSAKPEGPDAQVFRRLAFGDLATFHVLDDRQYRTYQACSLDGGSRVVPRAECPALDEPQATLLGWRQERWLDEGLAASGSRWNVLAQQTRMARRAFGPEEPGYWNDGWDGYSAARRRLLESIATRRPGGPLVIGGDIHAFLVAELRPDFERPETPAVATEFIGSSITSQGRTRERHAADVHIELEDGEHRGYAEATLRPREATIELRAADDIHDPASGVTTLRRYVVEAERPGAALA